MIMEKICVTLEDYQLNKRMTLFVNTFDLVSVVTSALNSNYNIHIYTEEFANSID